MKTNSCIIFCPGPLPWGLSPRARPCVPHTPCRASKLATDQETGKEWKTPLTGSHDRAAPAVVALGKFDALHKGHRSLAVRASQGGAQPWLLSFSGMAEVLGWPQRLPLVAPLDRARVLASWAPLCGRAPRERQLPFAAVRHMSPEEFVRLLAVDLQVSGVVVGEGYRFGYKAAGDTAALQELGSAYGLSVEVVPLLGSGPEGQVSSSRVREQLACGEMDAVADLLGRRYRLVGVGGAEDGKILRILPNAYLNLPPKEREYSACISVATMTDPRIETLLGTLHAAVTSEGTCTPLPKETDLGQDLLVNIDL